MKRLIVICLVLCTGLGAEATEISIVGHGLSYHQRNQEIYNQRNVGLGMRVDLGGAALQAGSYSNSYYRTSRYLLLDVTLIGQAYGHNMFMETGPTVGIVSGYPGHELLAGLGWHGSLRWHGMHLRTRAMPSMNAGTVFSVEVGYTILRW